MKPAKRTPPNTSRNKNSNTQRTENKMTDVVIHQHSRQLLKMDILMSETCWAHNKWNKIASDIKLVFHSSTKIHKLLSATSCLCQSTDILNMHSLRRSAPCFNTGQFTVHKTVVERLFSYSSYSSQQHKQFEHRLLKHQQNSFSAPQAFIYPSRPQC